MVESLRKERKDGTRYLRRPVVENELADLERLDLSEIVARAREGEQHGVPSVSSEALVHILRREVRAATTAGPTSGQIDAIASMLIARCERTLTRKLWRYDEPGREEIALEVTDRVVDGICADSDSADYAEINFNDWLAHNIADACRKQNRRAGIEQFSDELEGRSDDEAHIVPLDQLAAIGHDNTPEALYALKEARERGELPTLVADAELSSENLHRIREIVIHANLPPDVLNAFLAYHYLDMQIESEDPEKHTLVKHFGKSEKTIRNWINRAEKAFAELRKVNNEGDDESEPGRGAARLSH